MSALVLSLLLAPLRRASLLRLAPLHSIASSSLVASHRCSRRALSALAVACGALPWRRAEPIAHRCSALLSLCSDSALASRLAPTRSDWLLETHRDSSLPARRVCLRSSQQQQQPACRVSRETASALQLARKTRDSTLERPNLTRSRLSCVCSCCQASRALVWRPNER